MRRKWYFTLYSREGAVLSCYTTARDACTVPPCCPLTYILKLLLQNHIYVLNWLLLFIVLTIQVVLTGSKKQKSHLTQQNEHWGILVFFLAAHVETSIVAHLANASSQTEESKIAANFQTVYAKQFLLHKLYPNLNEQSRPVRTTMDVWSSRVRHSSESFKCLFLSVWYSFISFLMMYSDSDVKWSNLLCPKMWF